MLIKVSEAENEILDWMVELANGTHWSPNGYFVFERPTGTEYFDKRPEWNYSTDWSKAGPIIEREMIATSRGGSYSENFWCASRGFSDDRIYGPTPLVAAMRCYAVHKLGSEIDVPDEVLQNPNANAPRQRG